MINNFSNMTLWQLFDITFISCTDVMFIKYVTLLLHSLFFSLEVLDEVKRICVVSARASTTV